MKGLFHVTPKRSTHFVTIRHVTLSLVLNPMNHSLSKLQLTSTRQQCTYNVIPKCVPLSIVAVEKAVSVTYYECESVVLFI